MRRRTLPRDRCRCKKRRLLVQQACRSAYSCTKVKNGYMCKIIFGGPDARSVIAFMLVMFFDTSPVASVDSDCDCRQYSAFNKATHSIHTTCASQSRIQTHIVAWINARCFTIFCSLLRVCVRCFATFCDLDKCNFISVLLRSKLTIEIQVLVWSMRRRTSRSRTISPCSDLTSPMALRCDARRVRYQLLYDNDVYSSDCAELPFHQRFLTMSIITFAPSLLAHYFAPFLQTPNDAERIRKTAQTALRPAELCLKNSYLSFAPFQ